jgi:F0F1-type ATP synthase gamma subunit
MREATENARDMLDHLTLVANRARQKGITQQVLEISEGAQFAAPSEQ